MIIKGRQNADLTVDKTINDITFTGDGRFVVATAFGYVIIDDTKWEVKESRIFNRNVNSAAIVSGHLLLAADDGLYCGEDGRYYSAFDDYTRVLSSISSSPSVECSIQ